MKGRVVVADFLQRPPQRLPAEKCHHFHHGQEMTGIKDEPCERFEKFYPGYGGIGRIFSQLKV